LGPGHAPTALPAPGPLAGGHCTDIIFFTKFLAGLSAEEIAGAAKKLGFDGLDLAIRGGHAVNPANAKDELPKAMEVWKRAGLSVPLATLETGAVDPDAPEIEPIFAACGEAGIPSIKLGYWHWSADLHYWDAVDDIRRSLARFARLGERYGVCSLVHTHSGRCYGCNSSGAMHFARGFDPRYVGVYLDFAHLALCGEPLPMALDIVKGYLKMIGVKNARHLLGENGKWTTDWCLLSEGLVDWPAAIGLLKELDYDVPLTVHGEYSGPSETASVLAKVQTDMRYLRATARCQGIGLRKTQAG